MIKKYVYGNPFPTEAVVVSHPAETTPCELGNINTSDGFCFTYQMKDSDIVYGLGEANRGINKRGYLYVSNCSDEPWHCEDRLSFYGAHNFLILSGETTFGLFLDYPGKMSFDIGYTHLDTLKITCQNADLALYVITGENAYDIVKQFRRIIGTSYIPPKFAFGYGQSRWGYTTQEDFREVAEGYRKNHLPLDMIYMDIDYMERYKDFTVNKENFPDFGAFVQEMKDQDIRLVPIIDAGVKVEKGYDIYEEGVEKGYFCKHENGEDFQAAVWPGMTHFPDVLNPEARAWFGSKYERLISAGIEGFWNDMNEPAIFYTKRGEQTALEYMKQCVEGTREFNNNEFLQQALALQNSPEDYQSFYHNVNGQKIRHDQVHNLYGYNMTRAAAEGFEKTAPGKRFLMFSRSSYIGMHRYGGIWTGDNFSWWSHILLNLKMLPSLNMCGFLYIGADLGGFGCDTTEDLLLRWLALGVFTPLMRNHSADGTRRQECYRFDRVDDFRHILEVRYRLVPYLYSEYLKAATRDDLLFKPLAFVYPQDEAARTVEDQLMVGDEIMIAPVYTQNAAGRYVYLPEEMHFVKFCPGGTLTEEVLPAGHHYVEVALNEVPLFIHKDRKIPLVDAAECVEALDMNTLQYIGYQNASYELVEE